MLKGEFRWRRIGRQEVRVGIVEWSLGMGVQTSEGEEAGAGAGVWEQVPAGMSGELGLGVGQREKVGRRHLQ